MNVLTQRMLSALASVAISALMLSTALADPLPGRDVLKFSQKPLDGRPRLIQTVPRTDFGDTTN